MNPRLPIPIVLGLTQAQARMIAFASPEILAKFRRNGIESPELRAFLVAVHDAAIGTPDISAASRLVDAQQNPKIDLFSAEPALTWLRTKAAAERLGLPERRLTELLKKDRVLHGEQQNGDKGSWLISEAEVERYLAELEKEAS